MERVLPKVINNDQSSLLKGRSIAENHDILLIDGIIIYADNMDKPGSLTLRSHSTR